MYRIIGADGKEYGPIPAGQLRQWIAEGRANAETSVAVEGSSEWKPLGSIPEFSISFGTAAPPLPVTVPAGETGRLSPQKTNGFATASLVLGIVSLCCFCCYGLPFNLIGLVLALIGLAQINNNPQLYRGKGIAVAGLVLCVLSILFSVGLLFLAALGDKWQTLPRHTYRL
jgi:hypothetical protein